MCNVIKLLCVWMVMMGVVYLLRINNNNNSFDKSNNKNKHHDNYEYFKRNFIR
jgi:hypothetical protein